MAEHHLFGPKHHLAFLLAVGMACLLVAVSGCDSGASQTPSSTVTPTPTVTVVRTPTATPLPTISLSTPILGGSWQAFDKLFGDSNCCYRNGWQYQGPFGNTFTGVDDAGNNPTNQPDNPNARITNIDTSPQASPDTTWTAAQTQAMQAQFMPPDAKLKNTKPVYEATNLVAGIEKTYTSVLLARTLPAADFKDVKGKLAQPGVFYVYWSEFSSPVNRYSRCVIGTDESEVLTIG